MLHEIILKHTEAESLIWRRKESGWVATHANYAVHYRNGRITISLAKKGWEFTYEIDRDQWAQILKSMSVPRFEIGDFIREMEHGS